MRIRCGEHGEENFGRLVKVNRVVASDLVIYNASAGAGKTDTLAVRYIAHILRGAKVSEGWRGLSYRSTLCVTFTRKATVEMKERILSTLFKLSRGEAAEYIARGVSEHSGLSPKGVKERAGVALHLIVHDYTHFSVSTIDSFIQRMASALLWELGVGGEMRVSLSFAALVDRATANLFARPMPEGSELLSWLTDRLEDRLEDGGDYQLSKMLSGYGNALFSDNFAGRSLNEREQIFSLTRERQVRTKLLDLDEERRARVEKARRALENALKRADIGVEEFKGKGRSFMKSVLNATAVMPGAKWQALSDTVRKAYGGKVGEWFSKEQQLKWAGLIESLLPAYRALVDEYDAVRRDLLSCSLCRPLLAKISAMSLLRKELSDEERQSETLLLDDLSTMLLDLGGEQEAPFIYERMGTRYDSFLIDEFQDTSRRHWRLFEGLVRNGLAEGGLGLLVGDVKQAIYRFRGGDWKLLAHEIPAAFGVQPMHLEYNYRSSYNVVRFNNFFFKRMVAVALKGYCESTSKECDEEQLAPEERVLLRKKKREYLGEEGKEEEGIVQQAYAMVEQRVPSSVPEDGGYVEFRWFAEAATSEERNAHSAEQYVVEQLERAIDGQGIRQREVAVLVRRNDEAARVLAAVLENNKLRQGKEPIRMVTSDALSLDMSPDVQLVLAVLRMATRLEAVRGEGAQNSVEWILLSRRRMPEVEESGAWTFGLRGDAAEIERRWIAEQTMRPLLDVFDAICTRYCISLSDPYISDLYGKMYGYQREESVDIRGFLEWYDGLSESERMIELPESIDAVKLLTLHKSKGLEFRVVIMPMCGWPFRVGAPELWAEVRREGWPDSLLPFKSVKSAKESYFFLDALEEGWLEAIDSVNLLYVAFTRAKEQLYVNASGGTRNDDVWKNLLKPTLSGCEKEWDSLEERGPLRVATCGKCPAAGGEPPARVFCEEEVLVESRRELPRMQQTTRRGRAFEMEIGRQRHRELGEAMHTLFERRPSREQFSAVVQPFVEVGTLTAAQAEALWAEIEEDLQRSPLQECFAEGVTVFGERDILVGGKVLRPDRVVEFGEGAVVIDFKFAGRDARQHTKYEEQVRGYMDALRAMGYKGVEGFLWYLDPRAHGSEGGARVVRCGEKG